METKISHRVGAIDAFRSITMFLMLFVNDMAGLQGIPHWMQHARGDEDMMGFSDLIFPAFLFCVGLSVPFAVGARLCRGNDALQLLAHVFWRTVALVVMGMFLLRCEDVHGGVMDYPLFSCCAVAGFFLVWNVYPKAEGWRRSLYATLKWLGVGLLVGLLVDRDLHDNSIQTGWWGILGLIGWTYAVCSVTYIFLRGRLVSLVVAWFVAIVFSLIAHSDLLPWGWGMRFVLLPFIPSDWTLHALGMSGVMTSVVMQRMATAERQKQFLGLLIALGAVMLVAALMSHTHWIISKIQATPTWLFFCLALFFPLTALLYWLTDIKGFHCWYRPIRTAGSATLTCYMIPYVWYAVQVKANLWYPGVFYAGWPGLLRSVVFSLVVVWVVELLGHLHVKLKI